MIFFISSSLAQMLCFNILDTEYEAVPEAQPMIGLDHKCFLSLLFSITNWHWIHTCKDLNMFEISKSLLRGCLPVVGGLDKEAPCGADTHPLSKEPEWIIWKKSFCLLFFYFICNWQDLLGEPTWCKTIVLDQSSDVVVTLFGIRADDYCNC